MTFIRPNQHLTLTTILFALGGLLFMAEMVMMIYFYNRMVNLDAATLKAKNQTREVAAQIAILEQKTISALDGSTRYKEPYSSLVDETHPEYFNLHPHIYAKVISDAQR